MDLLGVVDDFNTVFDVESYKRNKSKAVGWLLSTCKGDSRDDNVVFAKEILLLYREEKKHISFDSYRYMLQNLTLPVWKAAKRKVRRFLGGIKRRICHIG